MEQILCCPKCESSQITANKKGFSGTKAVAGAILTGGIGLLAGTLGSNKIILTCLACGHRFRPGEGKTKYLTPVQNYSDQKVYSKPIENYTQSTSQGQQTQDKNTGIGCLVIIIIFLILGAVFGKSGCNKEDESEKNTLAPSNISSHQLTNADSLKIKEELVSILKSIDAANVDPRKAMNQFSKYSAGLSTYSSNISQVFQSAKIAKQKMQIAESEISKITIPQMLPQQLKDSLFTALSTISSSYLTLSGAFDEAMEMAKNPSDNSYVEAFRSDMNQATEMYGQALLDILKIQASFGMIQNKKRRK